MRRLSRVGRKEVMFGILRARHNMGKTTGVTVGYIARKMGLKSSTYLKDLLKEMCVEYDEIERLNAGDHSIYRFRPLVQTDFFDRVISINGKPISVRDEVESLLRLW